MAITLENHTPKIKSNPIIMTYIASIEWICEHAGIIRIHEHPHEVLGDPYVWCCTIERDETKTVAIIKGVCSLPSPLMIKAIDVALIGEAIQIRQYERKNSHNNRVINKILHTK